MSQPEARQVAAETNSGIIGAMSDVPRQALLLAAGLGTRLYPLNADLPKPLLPLRGRSLIARRAAWLSAAGVTDILVNLHAGAGDIWNWLRSQPLPGVRFSASFEPVVLGTGGALSRARWFFDRRPFWIVNSDIDGDPDPAAFVRALRARRAIAAVWVTREAGPRTVDIDGGYVTGFRSRSPGALETATFCGLQLARADLFDYAPPAGQFATLVQVYEAAIAAGHAVRAVELPGTAWSDVGTADRLLDAHRGSQPAPRQEAEWLDPRALAKAGACCRGFAWVSRDVRLAPPVAIEDAMVLPGARLCRGAVLRRAIVGRNAVVRGHVEGLVVRADGVVPPAALGALAWRLGTEVAAAALPQRGSDRVFLRLRGSRGRAMLIRYGRERPENERYGGHSRFLASLGLPVPAVWWEDAGDRWLAIEDAGDRTLANVLAGASPASARRAYDIVVRWIARWHIEGGRAARRRRLSLEEPFGPALYEREHRLFLDRFLAGYLRASAATLCGAARDLDRVAAWLADAPPVLLHRDLQSSNVLWRRGRPVFIDFQGMRFGPAMYDLASLLYDPYVALSEETRSTALRTYVAAVGERVARPDLFAPAAVQRLTQALGAFARLGAAPGTERFLRHIPPALARLAEAANACPTPLPALSAIARGEA